VRKSVLIAALFSFASIRVIRGKKFVSIRDLRSLKKTSTKIKKKLASPWLVH